MGASKLCLMLRSTAGLWSVATLFGTLTVLAAGLLFMATPIAGTDNQPVEIVSSGHDVSVPEDAIVIDIKEFNYSPDSISVPENAMVIWTNREPFDHDVTFQSSNLLAEELKSPRIGKGGKIMARFNEPGEYRYYCHLHPFMEGTVKVESE